MTRKGFKQSEETKQRRRETSRKHWADSKICIVCGSKFVRREDETAYAFRHRKKCHARCTSDTYGAITVLSYADIDNPEGDAGRDDNIENTFLSLTWLSQSKHWLRSY
jgi:hypothetical protein